MPSKILFVDDDESILSSLRRLARSLPCVYGKLRYELDVDTAASPSAALRLAGETAYDLIVSDYRMPEMNGVELLIKVGELQPKAELMVLSGLSDADDVARAYQDAKIYHFVNKPWNDSFLMASIAEALNHRELALEIDALKAQKPQ